MPRINAVRFVNILYDNNAKKIDNLYLTMNGGQNTLINLANGGGKSVMTLLQLQTMSPLQTSGRYSIDYYFKSPNNPAYLMTEWILDGDNKSAPEYLLTAIVIDKNQRDSSFDISGTSRSALSKKLNYFTFVHKYSMPNSMDIKNLQCIYKDINGITRFDSLEEARKKVSTAAESNPELWYFPKSETPKFKEFLKIFGISAEMWTSFMGSINSSENGFSSLIEDDKRAKGAGSSSDLLVDNVMLPGVEQKLLMESDGESSYLSNIDDLVKSLYNKDNDINMLSLYRRAEMEIKILQDNLSVVKENTKEKEELESTLSETYGNLTFEIHSLEKSISETEEEISQLNEMEASILHEERSENYYSAKKEFEKQESEYDNLKSDLATCEKEINEINEEYNEAAVFLSSYIKSKEAEEILCSIIKDLALSGEEEQNRELNHCKRLLSGLLSEEQKRLMDSEASLTTAIQKSKESQIECQEKIRTEEKEKKKKEHEKDTLNKDICRHELAEEEIQKAGLYVQRDKDYNLLQYLKDSNEKYFSDTLRQKKESLEYVRYEIRNHEEKIKELSKTEENTRFKIQETNIHLKELNNNLNNYKKDKEKLAVVLSALDDDVDTVIKNKAIILENYRDMISSLSFDLDQRNISINHIKEKLNSYKNNTMCLSSDVSNWLQENGIDYCSGMEFLQGRKEDYDNYIKTFPLLPYGIVVREKEFKKFSSVSIPIFTSFVPVFVIDEQFAPHNDGGVPISQMVFTLGEQKFLRHIEEGLIRDYEKFIAELEEKLNREETLKERDLRRKGNLENAKRELEYFPYDHETDQRFVKELQKTKETLEALEHICEKTSHQKREVEIRLSEAKDNLIECKDSLAKTEAEEQFWCDFLSRESAYIANKKNYLKLTEEIQNSNNSIGLLYKEISRLADNKRELEKEKETVTWKLKNIYPRLLELQNYEPLFEEGVSIEGVTNQINTLEELLNNPEVINLKKEKEHTEKLLSVYRDQIIASGLSEEILSRKNYTEKDKRTLENCLSEAEYEKRELEDKLQEVQTQMETAKKKYHETEALLMDRPPLPQSKIQGAFKERLRKNKEDVRLKKEAGRKYEERKKECNRCQNILLKYVDDDIILSVEDYSVTNITEEDVRELIHLYNNSVKGCNDAVRRYTKQYATLSSVCAKEEGLRNKFPNNYDESYHAFSYAEWCDTEIVVSQNLQAISMQIINYERSLDVVQKEQEQVYALITNYAERLYSGLKEMIRESRSKINGRQQDLIRCDALKDLADGASFRMKEYMKNRTDLLINLLKNDRYQGENDDKYKRMLRDTINPANLIRSYIGKKHLPVKVWKLEEDPSHCRWIPWEEGRSGGEGAATAFYIAVAKLKYMTKDEKKSNAGIVSWNAMWLDNPFAKMNAKHLLEPLYEIAKSQHIQLIALTGLEDSNLFNVCDTVYSLRFASYNDGLKRLLISQNKKMEEMHSFRTIG